MRLVLAEKPSVARDLAQVLGATTRRQGYLEGDGLVISWCVGHLLELEDPAHYNADWKAWRLDALPMVPEDFALRAREGAKDQWTIVRGLLRDKRLTHVVNACDAGREGELIFRYAYQHAGCKAPVQRFWASSLTESAIRRAWQDLRAGTAYDNLADAARCRSEADWLVGLNLTRALTCRTRDQGGDALWSVGRVQTPTLAMIVGRDAEIEAFDPVTYWTVRATCVAEAGEWTGHFVRAEGLTGASPAPKAGSKGREETPAAQRLATLADAELVVAALQDRTGEVVSARRTSRNERPPQLYDLTSLQRRANQRYGFPADRTLEVAQALYERHKLITYPRTDARYLTTDQADTLPDVVAGVGELPVYRPFCEALLARGLRPGPRMVDDAEVGDHHAILPTGRRPDAGRLHPDEKRIYDLVARRLLAALSPDAQIDLAELVVAVPTDAPLPSDVTSPVHLRAKGRVLREAGWQAVDPPRARKDTELPLVEVGDAVTPRDPAFREAQTKPPRPYDDASLLRAMETAGKQLDDAQLKRALRNAGLGTPATRAAILSTLTRRKYVRREGRALRATATGQALIAALPVAELKSAELTGRWERRLAEMAEGRDDRSRFMQDVVGNLAGLVAAVAQADLPEAALVRTRPVQPSLGTCPACATPVRPRGSGKKVAVYACETGRSCPFVVFGTMSGRAISARMVKELLTSGRTAAVKGFRSKKGKEFSAGLMVRDDHSVGFWFEGDDRDRDRRPPTGRDTAPAQSRPGSPVGMSCPSCSQGQIIAGRTAWGCSRWREGCVWRLDFAVGGARRTEADAVAHIEGQRRG